MQLALKHLVTSDTATVTADTDILLSIPVGKSVLLENVDWQTFEKILTQLGDRRAARLAYDRGTLEIMAPLPEHEYYKQAVGDLVKDLADVLDVDYETLGSTTWKRPDLLAGVEPDNCFYFQHELEIRGN
ncbi:Uma2 family endonuclease [Gloeocapsopsis crepidinum]|uniref:Uma2 family endonuclease n=1 Tax=Gloeocapsopsis crepidinum TaxID=693223 RepID=UPI002AD464FA|nr:Uma2 family endonuclease [Gloeocapsopsis crepidinum]